MLFSLRRRIYVRLSCDEPAARKKLKERKWQMRRKIRSSFAMNIIANNKRKTDLEISDLKFKLYHYPDESVTSVSCPVWPDDDPPAPTAMTSLKGTAFVPRIAAAPFHDFPAGVAICPSSDSGRRLRHALHQGVNVHERKMLLLT